VVRLAFTMIELIFAIVIIGITVISLPMMSQVTAKGMEANLVQEAIFAASTELNQAVTMHWDENSMEDGDDTLARVIDTGDCDDTTRLRLGHITQPLHRRCLDSNLTAIANTKTIATVDALNDSEHASSNIFTSAITDQTGYKQNYNSELNITSGVIFGTDQVNANQNIKRVTVTIRDTNGTTITVLSTYSANIGEVDYYKRSY